MSLPAEFVDRATLPLILDPLIGDPADVANFSVFTSTFNPELDLAHLGPANLYYSAWGHTDHPQGAGAISGRLLSAQGDPIGPVHDFLDFSSGPFYASDVCIAGIAGSRRFAVAMIGGLSTSSQLWMTTLDEFGVATKPKQITSHDVSFIDIGGEATLDHSDVIAVYVLPNAYQIGLAQIDSTTLSVKKTVTLTINAGGILRPVGTIAISPTGGAVGRYLVTWQSGYGGSQIRGMVIDRDLNVLASDFQISGGPDTDRTPEVDGDGTNWVVAFQRSTGAGDILCRGVTFDPNTGSVTFSKRRIVQADPNRIESDPSVAWMGESYLIGHSRQWNGTDWDVIVHSVESLFCEDCEGRFPVYNPSTTDTRIRMASQRSSGGTGNEVLMTWVVDDGTSSPLGDGFVLDTVKQRRFQPIDGLVTNLGGGCGSAGIVDATCALSGTTNFGIRLEQSAPLVPVLLAVGIDPLGFSCGPCTLVLNPLRFLPTSTSASGEASLTLALPPSLVMAGTKFMAQWIIATPSPCPSLQLSLSDALEITVQ